jgi:hypothetical protein
MPSKQPSSVKLTVYRSFALVALVYLFGSIFVPRSNCQNNVAISWNNAALQGVRDAKLQAPMVARALSIVNTCMYDAWSAYDQRAVGTQLAGTLRRPSAERTVSNMARAVSYAAYRALSDVFPTDRDSVYTPLMKKLGYDPTDDSTDIETPEGIGNVACAAVLEFRHHDNANQLGDLAQGPYSDWSGYQPATAPATVPVRLIELSSRNLDHWQPLTFVDANGNLVVQKFAAPQWCFVTPFALRTGAELRALLEPGPAHFGSPEYEEQAQELISISAGLTDRQKMIAEYWLDGPRSEQPPGHWILFAEFISQRDHHSLDDDVKMYFVVTNTMLDAAIAAWDAKRAYDSVRPVTAIESLYRHKTIRAWGGPGSGTIEMDGSQWIPYQPATAPTPPFPDYVSGHSTYSAAAARILGLWTGSDRFGYSVTMEKGSSKIEHGTTPREPVTLRWETFRAAADEAGMSRRYGGIHFRRADLAGRALGRAVADKVWPKANAYFDGTNSNSYSALGNTGAH